MKRLLAIIMIAAFSACGGGNNETSNGADVPANEGNASTADSISRASDSVMQTGDTSALNSRMGDSTSSSGSHGEGSGSRVGGGNTGGPQGKKGQ